MPLCAVAVLELAGPTSPVVSSFPNTDVPRCAANWGSENGGTVVELYPNLSCTRERRFNLVDEDAGAEHAEDPAISR